MRPLYEKAEDRKRELQVAMAIQRDLKKLGVVGADLVKLPENCAADWVVKWNKKPVVLLEIKCRTNERDAYATYMLSKRKVEECLEVCEEKGISFFVVVRWTDGTFGREVTELPLDIRMGGRRDRNDPDDMELMCHWPYSEFNLHVDI